METYTSEIDIFLIQEPYIFKNIRQQIIKKLPSYENFAPTDSWTISGWSRVLTYVRREIGFQTSQMRPFTIDYEEVSDLLFLQVLSPSGKSTLISHIYNAPPKALITLPEM